MTFGRAIVLNRSVSCEFVRSFVTRSGHKFTDGRSRLVHFDQFDRMPLLTFIPSIVCSINVRAHDRSRIPHVAVNDEPFDRV
jgi:hypothetical protein